VEIDVKNGQYLVCAVLVDSFYSEEVRSTVRSLAVSGQKKLHWSKETAKRRQRIVKAISEIQCKAIIIRCTYELTRNSERYRRKCLHALYRAIDEFEHLKVIVESRERNQDQADVNHLVSLRNSKEIYKFRVTHLKGREEPLLWLPDIYLGVANSLRHGRQDFYDAVKKNIIADMRIDS